MSVYVKENGEMRVFEELRYLAGKVEGRVLMEKMAEILPRLIAGATTDVEVEFYGALRLGITIALRTAP